jgi:hypothetical protein
MNLNDLFSGVTMTLPGWAVAAAGFGLVLLLILVMRPRSDTSGLATLAQLALVAVVAGAAYFGLKQYENNSRFVERKAIEDRAAALLSHASQPGSVLGCLNAASPVLDEACEKTIFAEPQRITSAIAVTADRVALLYDATTYSTREPAFLDRFDHLRKSLEADPYGIVAHILATEHKCLPNSCPRFRIFKDADKVKANLTGRKFDDLLNKYKETWAKTGPGISISESLAMPPLRTLGTTPDDDELPNWDSLSRMHTPNGQTSTAPVILPPQRQTQPPAANTNERPAATPASLPQNQQVTPPARPKAAPAAQQKQQPQTPPQARRKGPPEPVGGLPRVLGRRDPATLPQADDDDDTPTPTPAPPPPQQNRSPFGIFGR